MFTVDDDGPSRSTSTLALSLDGTWLTVEMLAGMEPASPMEEEEEAMLGVPPAEGGNAAMEKVGHGEEAAPGRLVMKDFHCARRFEGAEGLGGSRCRATVGCPPLTSTPDFAAVDKDWGAACCAGFESALLLGLLGCPRAAVRVTTRASKAASLARACARSASIQRTVAMCSVVVQQGSMKGSLSDDTHLSNTAHLAWLLHQEIACVTRM